MRIVAHQSFPPLVHFKSFIFTVISLINLQTWSNLFHHSTIPSLVAYISTSCLYCSIPHPSTLFSSYIFLTTKVIHIFLHLGCHMSAHDSMCRWTIFYLFFLSQRFGSTVFWLLWKILIAVLLLIAKTWKQLKCPLSKRNKLWYSYTIAYYSVLKEMCYQAMKRQWGCLITKWKKPVWEKVIYHRIPAYHILEKAKLWRP
jgi:hypothetical protein